MTTQTRDYRAEDAEAVRGLWSRCFGNPAGGQTVDWLFRPGPAGEAPRSVVEVDGRVVAHAGVAPMRFLLSGEAVRGGYSVGAMTDPEFQGQGLFVQVGEHLYDRLEREGFAFVAGFSNARSHHLMTTRLGRTPLRPFPWCIRILRPVAAARSLLLRSAQNQASAEPPESKRTRTESGGLVIEPCEAADGRLDQLWQRAGQAIRIGGVRDAAFARWRFSTRPDARYETWLALRSGEPVAWAVHRDLGLRGVRARFLVDWLVAPGDPRDAGTLLRAIEGDARRRGVALMSALMPGDGPGAESLGRAGYRRVPERLHPQKIRFSVRGFGRHRGLPLLVDLAAWYLAWSDTDVV